MREGRGIPVDCAQSNFSSFLLLQFSLYRVAFSVPYIQRGPEKNGTGYFLQYVDALTGMVSVYGITSPEKNYTKISNFG